MKQVQLLILILVSCITVHAQLIVQVHDGDTYKVLLKGKVQTVRLQNVDAPEISQYFGKASRDSVAALIGLHTVQLEVQGSDIYGRLLVHIHVNGKRLDSLLIAKGWAWHYVAYSHNNDLSGYETEAKLKGLGIWHCAYNVPP
jgi:micrococcal nuclease